MKKMKQEKGITLIALIVTIIVLLILAGVAIIMLSGENGILRQAAKAKIETEKAIQDEKDALDEMEFIMGSQGKPWEEDVAEGFGGGEGTESNPYLIYNAEQLTYLAQQANQGETYEGKYIKIMNDIDLKYRKFTPIAIGYEEEIQTGYYDFTKNVFQGNIDGQGYTIKGININEPQINGVGIIGGLGEKATINNLNIGAGKIIANTCAGGIAGSSKGNIMNCSNSAQVILKSNGQTISSQIAAGIVGWGFEGNIEKCINYGDVSAEYQGEGTNSGLASGGIVGCIYAGNVNSCENFGDISVGNWGVGGIAGLQCGNVVISNCTNSGEVHSEGEVAGGIVGYIDGSSAKVIQCTNNSDISTEEWGAGGIAGRMITGIVESCDNEGGVTAEYKQAGGIIGYIDNGNVESCSNKGIIVAKYDLNNSNDSGLMAGGICGIMVKGSVKKCENNGEVIAEYQQAGGIIGCMDNGTIESCCNLSKIESGTKKGAGVVGGIVGWQKNGVVQQCFSIGDIVNKPYNLSTMENLGGITGFITKGTIKYSYSNCKFDVGDYRGGVIGEVNTSYTQTIENCYYSGELTKGIGNKSTDIAGKTDKVEELTDFDSFKQWITNKFPDLSF